MAFGLAAWIVAAGLWISGQRAAKAERAQQHPLTRVQLSLDHATDWRTATFTPPRSGSYAVMLESSNPTVPTRAGLFGGAFDLEIADPYGRIVFQRRVDGQAIEHPVAAGTVTTAVGRFKVPGSGRGVWAFSARVVRGDARFAPALSAAYVTPPGALDAMWERLKIGGLVWLGAILLGFGGRLTGLRHKRLGATPGGR